MKTNRNAPEHNKPKERSRNPKSTPRRDNPFVILRATALIPFRNNTYRLRSRRTNPVSDTASITTVNRINPSSKYTVEYVPASIIAAAAACVAVCV
jgi:hypothetical protein